MSASSEINLKQSLRKLEYPICAQESLNKIAELICGRITSIKNMDFALDLMSEFIFCEVDRRGIKRLNVLLPLMELQLLDLLLEYFSNISNESSKNTVFLSLFSGTTAIQRSSVLSKLVSIAIGIPSTSILISASTWMQQLGSTSVNSCKLAEAIIQDYFFLTPIGTVKLKHLSNIAPQFTANFLTAAAENYFLNTKKGQVFPPDSLLEMITFWISENPSLCVAAQQKHAVLPPGAIAMEATTPIAGLLRWCILAPIFNQNKNIYGRLHLSLLNSISEISYASPPKAICAQHLIASISAIMIYVGELKKQHKTLNEIIDNENLQIALDRQAQAVQIALSAKCIYGKTDDLLNQLQMLPYNKLMKIVTTTNRQIK